MRKGDSEDDEVMLSKAAPVQQEMALRALGQPCCLSSSGTTNVCETRPILAVIVININ